MEASVLYSGVHKEMSSILADQERPRIRAQMQVGGGGCEVSTNENSWSPNTLWRDLTPMAGLQVAYGQFCGSNLLMCIERKEKLAG